MTKQKADSVRRGAGLRPAGPTRRWALAGLWALLAAPFATAQGLPSQRLEALLGGGFLENTGQWPDEVWFATCAGQARLWVGRRSVTFLVAEEATGQSVAVTLEVESPDSALRAVGVDPLPGICNFMRGSDPARWVTGARAFRQVAFETSDGGARLCVKPHGSGVVLRLDVDPRVRPDGLTLRLLGPVVAGDGGAQAAAVGPIRQECRTCGTALACGGCGGGLRRDGSVLHWAPASPPGSAQEQATIGLVWSTFLAGDNSDRITAAGFASDGSVIFGGNSFSMDFPTTPGSFDPTHAPPNPLFFNYDIVVGRLTPDGSELVYSTFLAGHANDVCKALVVASGDEPVVLGDVSSFDYPTTPSAFDPTYGGGFDAAVTRLAADGTALVFSTLLGGSSLEVSGDIALASGEEVLVCGETASADFPVTAGAYQTMLATGGYGRDGFVSRLAADGQHLLWSTFIGKDGFEDAEGCAEFSDGSVAVAGTTNSADFPVSPDALQTAPSDDYNISYVARLAANGTDLVWATYFGGNASHELHDLAVDGTDNITIAGTLNFISPPSTWFPTTEGSFDPTWNGNPDTFVARIDPTGTQLLWSTFLGGGGQDDGWDVVLDPSGVVNVFGATRSDDFPVTAGAYDEVHNFDWDFFAARLSPAGDRLFYATFVGGSNHEPYLSGKEMDGAVNLEGEVVLAGSTRSPDYPVTPGAFDEEPHLATGGTDGVLTRLTLLPAGVTGHGASTPGCAGTLTIGVTAMPQVGSEAFGLWCGGTQAFSPRGFVGVSLLPLDEPLLAAGLLLWLDPASLLALPVTSDATGYCEVPLRIEADPALVGLGAWVQFFWWDPCGPSGWAASRALGITVQP